MNATATHRSVVMEMDTGASANLSATTPFSLPGRSDALPENTSYSDSGCDLYPSCLQCPLPRCRYEEPGGARAMLRTTRNVSIERLAYDDGLSVSEIAGRFGLSRRTVFRVLRGSRSARLREDSRH